MKASIPQQLNASEPRLSGQGHARLIHAMDLMRQKQGREGELTHKRITRLDED